MQNIKKTLAEDTRATKLSPLSKPQKEKYVSWVEK